jgi:uncharacterized protein (DUF1330 family)
MPKGYWIANMDVHDPVRYGAYQRFVRPFLAANGGRFIVRGGTQDIVEGTAHARTVVVEFESYETALAVYRSDEYRKGMEHRLDAATTDLIVVEGFDDEPPPGTG